jgi:hypothetical protein
MASPFPPTLADDKGNVSITEPADQDMTTMVSPGDIMIWQKSGDISSIVAITETGGVDVFSINPAQQADGSWQATVGTMPSGSEETYSITYTIGGVTYTQDPKLRMN